MLSEKEALPGNEKSSWYSRDCLTIGPLLKKGFSPQHCVVEWAELKILVRSYIADHSQWIHQTLWADILTANEAEIATLQNVLALVQIMLVMPMHSALRTELFTVCSDKDRLAQPPGLTHS